MLRVCTCVVSWTHTNRHLSFLREFYGRDHRSFKSEMRVKDAPAPPTNAEKRKDDAVKMLASSGRSVPRDQLQKDSKDYPQGRKRSEEIVWKISFYFFPNIILAGVLNPVNSKVPPRSKATVRVGACHGEVRAGSRPEAQGQVWLATDKEKRNT